MINLKDLDKKKGAIEALTQILASREREIRVKNDDKNNKDTNKDKLKMPKNVKTIDVDEEDKKNGEEETEEERKEREKQAEEDNDPKIILRDLKAIKNELDAISKSREKKNEEKAWREHEKELIVDEQKIANGSKHLDYKWFYRDLENAIRSQITVSNKYEDSYNSYNSTYAGTGFLMPGEERSETKDKPIIYVYFDKSGSLNSSIIKQALESLSFLNELEANKDIKEYKSFFFSDVLSDKEEDMRNGTGSYPDILKHIRDNNVDNAIIFTDNDFDKHKQYNRELYGLIDNRSTYARQFKSVNELPYVKVDGCVWWIWANGKTARNAWPHLVSINPLATYHYNLNTNQK